MSPTWPGCASRSVRIAAESAPSRRAIAVGSSCSAAPTASSSAAAPFEAGLAPAEQRHHGPGTAASPLLDVHQEITQRQQRGGVEAVVLEPGSTDGVEAGRQVVDQLIVTQRNEIDGLQFGVLQGDAGLISRSQR